MKVRADGRRFPAALPLVKAMTAAYLPVLVLVSFQLAGCTPGSGAEPWHSTWMDYGGGPDQSKYVALTQIDRSNVARLEMAWFYPTEDNISYSFNPIVANGMMYVLAKNNSLVALDAATGEEIWIHANLRGLPRRGLNYWQSADGTDRRILIQLNDYLQAIDATTGQSILTFGDDGLVDLKQGLSPRVPESVRRGQSSTPGVVWRDLIILGSAPGENYMAAPGHVRAYNVVNGELVWTFHTVPQPGEYGYETWPPDAYKYIGGANVWAELSVDAERGIVFAPTGSPNYDFYGADRHGENLFANTLLALDARTGERLWHYQLVHHDLRDFDLAAAPQLVTVDHDGRQIDAVAVATKQGFLYAFHRETGEPLWPIEERPVPQSDVPGEQSWPTQPFPTVLPPFARQSITSADLNPLLTDEERALWTARIDSLVARGRMGVFTPLSHTDWTIAIPGTTGGANYGQTAANPERGLVFVISNDWPSFYEDLELRRIDDPPPPPPAFPRGGGAGGGQGGPRGGGPGDAVAAAALIALGQTIYARECQVCHAPNRAGMGAAPSLLGIETRYGLADFQALVRGGRGKMPAFAYLSDDEVRALHRYLGGNTDGTIVDIPEGPVVASGGAPGGLLPRQTAEATSAGRYGTLYPDDVGAPLDRYFIRGYGQEYAYVITPPWSSVVAYDLNEGTIKWQRPLGQDKLAAEAGLRNTGVPETLRNGMVVTSTGLVFSNAKDGKVYAFDQDTGEELWAGQLPTGSEGIPAMYEVDGRQYLVVAATTPITWSRRTPEGGAPRRGYAVFALPQAD
jgi:quinoprotein glucose dehydrogenase